MLQIWLDLNNIFITNLGLPPRCTTIGLVVLALTLTCTQLSVSRYFCVNLYDHYDVSGRGQHSNIHVSNYVLDMLVIGINRFADNAAGDVAPGDDVITGHVTRGGTARGTPIVRDTATARLTSHAGDFYDDVWEV